MLVSVSSSKWARTSEVNSGPGGHMKTKMVVRVIHFTSDKPGFASDQLPFWLEHFSRAGYVNWITRDEEISFEGQRIYKQVFDMLPPRGVDVPTWLKHTSGRMQSFGLSAVIAPMWQSKETKA